MNKLKFLFAMLVFFAVVSQAKAATEPIKVRLAGYDFLLPLQKVSATQLYSFDQGKGYPGIETVLAAHGTWQLTAGAAPVLGQTENLAFAGFQFRLPAPWFDTKNNAIMFGAWVGKESDKKHASAGLKASVPLW